VEYVNSFLPWAAIGCTVGFVLSVLSAVNGLRRTIDSLQHWRIPLDARVERLESKVFELEDFRKSLPAVDVLVKPIESLGLDGFDIGAPKSASLDGVDIGAPKSASQEDDNNG
jgi:hypothetical protein